jgi:hypothetical protein
MNDLESLSDAIKASRRLRGGELEDIVHLLRRNLLLRELASRDFTNFERKTSSSTNLHGG